MSGRIFFPKTAAKAESPMNPALFFEGSNDSLIGFDIETYSPNGFPGNMEDPVVSFSLTSPMLNDLRKGLLSFSLLCHPSFEKELLTLLYGWLSSLAGHSLVTYNGSKFDIQYVVSRGKRFELDFQKVFSDLSHIDLYKLVRWLDIKPPNYSQKILERHLGLNRIIEDMSGSSYYLLFDDFLRNVNLKPLFYNIEDSAGCLRILARLLPMMKSRLSKNL